MSLTIRGKITEILPIESGTSSAGKDWRKTSFVIDSGAQFNPNICFGLFGDEKIALIDNLKEGDEIDVSFNVSSREFNNKWYTQADAWKITKLAQSAQQEDSVPSATEEDNLPF